jgi:hypothetical protein
MGTAQSDDQVDRMAALLPAVAVQMKYVGGARHHLALVVQDLPWGTVAGAGQVPMFFR